MLDVSSVHCNLEYSQNKCNGQLNNNYSSLNVVGETHT